MFGIISICNIPKGHTQSCKSQNKNSVVMLAEMIY